ncbi:MAG: hypothetical protein J6K12_01020 [Clostridia bacterium]|nr:hypothetical protein [Clostridia bacterium]
MQLKLFILLTFVLCIFSGCTAKENVKQNITANHDDLQQVGEVENDDTQIQQIMEYLLQQESLDYKLVQPDISDLQMITSDLDYILSMFHNDYDCTKDNIYDYLFSYNHLDYVYPNYFRDITFVSEPLQPAELSYMRWSLYEVPKKDPLGRFPEIPQKIYDEEGNIDKDLAWEHFEASGTPWLEMCIGYNKFSGEYIDLLVEGVWNGKVDHETFFEFEDGTLLYYHDDYYYTPALAGGKGGGIFYGPHIENLIPLENNLFKLEYHLDDDIYRCDSHNTAIIGLKEKDDGSRFWSIFSVDYNYVGNKFNY